jgi:hypothetical protein
MYGNIRNIPYNTRTPPVQFGSYYPSVGEYIENNNTAYNYDREVAKYPHTCL